MLCYWYSFLLMVRGGGVGGTLIFSIKNEHGKELPIQYTCVFIGNKAAEDVITEGAANLSNIIPLRHPAIIRVLSFTNYDTCAKEPSRNNVTLRRLRLWEGVPVIY